MLRTFLAAALVIAAVITAVGAASPNNLNQAFACDEPNCGDD